MQDSDSSIFRKKDGFNGQKAIVLPGQVIRSCERNPLVAPLYLTDIGFYPKARFHYRERQNGCPQDILIYCVDGEGWINIENQTQSISQGQFLIIPKKTRHSYGADEYKPWSIYWVHFKGSLSDQFTLKLKKGPSSFINQVSFDERRVELFDEICGILESGYSTDHLHYVNMCLWKYLASFCYPGLNRKKGDELSDETDIAIRYMQEHIHETVSLQDMANLVHLSTSHFSSIFKKKTGYSPVEYFIHIKIQKACQFLEFTDIHVKELCYKLGFNDPFYFSRLFSKYMGLSPVEYRKKKKAG
jgi:AraC-like DNA-binding protein/mannose-6-phosphate isomerase-like protein (cupin superfamily)